MIYFNYTQPARNKLKMLKNTQSHSSLPVQCIEIPKPVENTQNPVISTFCGVSSCSVVFRYIPNKTHIIQSSCTQVARKLHAKHFIKDIIYNGRKKQRGFLVSLFYFIMIHNNWPEKSKNTYKIKKAQER